MSDSRVTTDSRSSDSGSGMAASIGVSMLLHLALLGTLAVVGAYAIPESVEKPAEVTWQDPDHGEPVTLLTSPVSTELFEPTDDIGNTLIALEHTGLPPLSIAPGGGQGTGFTAANPASDSRTKAGTGNGIGVAGVGNGVGEGTGNGKGPGFFGRRMSGERVVYVVDSSQSMNHPHPGPGKTRLGRVKLELINSIRNLDENQKFFIVFFNERPIPMPAERMITATRGSKLKYLEWMIKVPGDGHTDPALALLMALRLEPDTIFFLTDGDFRPTIVKELKVSNRKGVTIHTIGFSQDRGEKLLQTIAEQNNGTYFYVPPDEDPDATPSLTSPAPMPPATASAAPMVELMP